MYPSKEEIDRYTKQMYEFHQKRRPDLSESVVAPPPPMPTQEENSSAGTLKVFTTTANRTIPVPDTSVIVSLPDSSEVLFRGETDISGIVDNISLPAPDPALSETPQNSQDSYSTYNLLIEHPDYQPVFVKKLPIFSGIESIQAVDLVLKSVSGSDDVIVIAEENAEPRR